MSESQPAGTVQAPSLLGQHSSSASFLSLATLSGDEGTCFLHANEKYQDLEKCDIIEPVQEKRKSSGNLEFLGWMIINTLATIGIVFTNKAIFADPALRLNQSTFAAFHFIVTGATLYVVSRPAIGMFTPSRARFVEMLPLALAMCLNVILPNLSLAFSSIAFYQIVRVLLTPLVAIINFVFYGIWIPRKAVLTIIPICVGVTMVSYYDTRPVKRSRWESKTATPTTSFAGVCFAFSGVVASSMYTVWIGTYHKKFKMNSMQLLFNQAPISVFILLYVIPFTDQAPHWNKVPQSRWMMILLSGVMASLINISQFFIIAGSGPVSSTVVGHLKTCSIVALGWATSDRKSNDRGIFGILLAVSGIITYSIVMYQHKQDLQRSSQLLEVSQESPKELSAKSKGQLRLERE